MGMGYEYLYARPQDKVKGSLPVIQRSLRYAGRCKSRRTADVDEKLKAKSVEPGKYDLVLDPSHLMA